MRSFINNESIVYAPLAAQLPVLVLQLFSRVRAMVAKRGFEQIKTPAETVARSNKRRAKNRAQSGEPAVNRSDDDSELGAHLNRIANYTDDSVPEHLRYWPND